MHLISSSTHSNGKYRELHAPSFHCPAAQCSPNMASSINVQKVRVALFVADLSCDQNVREQTSGLPEVSSSRKEMPLEPVTTISVKRSHLFYMSYLLIHHFNKIQYYTIFILIALCIININYIYCMYCRVFNYDLPAPTRSADSEAIFSQAKNA